MRTEANTEEDCAAIVSATVPHSPWRVIAVEPLPAFRLQVRFRDDTHGLVDLGELIHGTEAGVFAALRDETVFNQVYVALGAVSWPIGLDLAPDAMHAAIKSEGVWNPR